ncbi:hypothetical protein [Pseudomonas sp. SDO5561_S422]
MKKQHGPAFKAQQITVAQCTTCRGRTVVRGVFHELPCPQCNASGWVSAETGDALPLDVLVTQLGLMLHRANTMLGFMGEMVSTSAESRQYNQNNRRGPGATNFTGD